MICLGGGLLPLAPPRLSFVFVGFCLYCEWDWVLCSSFRSWCMRCTEREGECIHVNLALGEAGGCTSWMSTKIGSQSQQRQSRGRYRRMEDQYLCIEIQPKGGLDGRCEGCASHSATWGSSSHARGGVLLFAAGVPVCVCITGGGARTTPP